MTPNPTGADLTLAAISVGDELPELAYEVTATTVVLGALAARDWRPMHHDYDFAVNRNGTRNIFLNTPNLAAWYERYLTDWTGPKGRMGRLQFRMRDSIFPDDTMVLRGVVTSVDTDPAGCGWAQVDVIVSVGATVASEAQIRVAVPTDPGDNPWTRRGDRWIPDPERATSQKSEESTPTP